MPALSADEVNDGSGDAAEADLGPSATRRDGEAGEFLGLDGRRQRGVAEQRLRNAELAHRRPETLADQPSPAGQKRQPDEQPQAGSPDVLILVVGDQQFASRTCQADQRHDRPDHERSAFDA